jgi:hypothetical protein
VRLEAPETVPVRLVAAIAAIVMPTGLAASAGANQAPGAGWVMQPAADGEVQLIFSIIFDGKVHQRSADSVMVQAIAAPNMLVDRLSLDLVLNGEEHHALDAPPYFAHQIYSPSAEFQQSAPAGLQVMVSVALGRFLERVATDSTAERAR